MTSYRCCACSHGTDDNGYHGCSQAAYRPQPQKIVAADLRAQGLQLCEIGIRLAVVGFLPKDGGIRGPSTVHALLATDGLLGRMTEGGATPEAAT